MTSCPLPVLRGVLDGDDPDTSINMACNAALKLDVLNDKLRGQITSARLHESFMTDCSLLSAMSTIRCVALVHAVHVMSGLQKWTTAPKGQSLRRQGVLLLILVTAACHLRGPCHAGRHPNHQSP